MQQQEQEDTGYTYGRARQADNGQRAAQVQGSGRKEADEHAQCPALPCPVHPEIEDRTKLREMEPAACTAGMAWEREEKAAIIERS